MIESIKRTCWCYISARYVAVEGQIDGRRQADLLKINNCIVKDCPQRSSRDCLIGKIIEGKWKC